MIVYVSFDAGVHTSYWCELYDESLATIGRRHFSVCAGYVDLHICIRIARQQVLVCAQRKTMIKTAQRRCSSKL